MIPPCREARAEQARNLAPKIHKNAPELRLVSSRDQTNRHACRVHYFRRTKAAVCYLPVSKFEAFTHYLLQTDPRARTFARRVPLLPLAHFSLLQQFAQSVRHSATPSLFRGASKNPSASVWDWRVAHRKKLSSGAKKTTRSRAEYISSRVESSPTALILRAIPWSTTAHSSIALGVPPARPCGHLVLAFVGAYHCAESPPPT